MTGDSISKQPEKPKSNACGSEASAFPRAALAEIAADSPRPLARSDFVVATDLTVPAVSTAVNCTSRVTIRRVDIVGANDQFGPGTVFEAATFGPAVVAAAGGLPEA